MKKIRFKITGDAPLLMHNGQLADVSDPYVMAIKEISSKRSKVAADYEEMARLEFLGGLYLDQETNDPIIPSHVMEASIIGRGGAARMERMGKESAAGLWILNDAKLEYDGSRNPDELWKNKKFVHQALVSVQRSRVKRTRPIFREWAAEFELQFDEEILNEEDVKRWVAVAGAKSGLCDWRPRFGRFSVEWL